MKKIIFFTLALCMIASVAVAKDVSKRFGIGFVSTEAPIGGRYWFSDKVGLDVGIGLKSEESYVSTDKKESSTTFIIDIGVPITVINTGDRVNFNVRPGFRYTAPEEGSAILISAALEFEVFITDDFSVSAAHGLGVDIVDNGQENNNSTTDFALFGENWTGFGFHYYFQAAQ